MKLPPNLKFFLLVALLTFAASACAGAQIAPSNPTPANVLPASPESPSFLPSTEQSYPAPDTPSPYPAPTEMLPTDDSNQVATEENNSTPPLSTINMFDAMNGWGLTDQLILHTSDGGIQWADVTPQGGFASGSLLDSFFLDASAAWVLPFDPQNVQDPDSGVLFHSSDAGQTWEMAEAPFGGGQMHFIDPQNGWVMVGRGAAAGSSAVDIYRTADGGQTWEKIYAIDPENPDQPGDLPFAGSKNGLSFRDLTHGWVGGHQPQEGYVWLFATQDGGQTWQHQDLDVPEELQSSFISVDPPVFFSEQDGVLPVTFFLDTASRVFYVTHDGGATWSSTAPVPVGGAYSLASMQDFFVWDGVTLAASHDAGQTWTQITPNINLEATLAQIDFVDVSTGWAISMDVEGNGQLYRTTDGGATWEMLP